MENKVLALVNGQEITERDLDTAIARFPQDRQRFLSTTQGREQLLERMISFELLYSYAVDENLNKDEEYTAQLKQLEKEVLTQYAVGKILSKVEVTDKEAEDYYTANANLFTEGETVSAKHILVATEEEAEKIAKEIESGKSFEDAAAEYSSCPSKAQGGNLGVFGRGQMVPEFEEAAFELEIGKVSVPVKTQFGYHLIKVEAKNPAKVKSLEECMSTIKAEILQERQSYKYAQFTEELKQKYSVEIVE